MPDVVGGPDDLLPRIGRELAFRQQPPDLVVEDLGGGARDRPETVLLARDEELPEGHAHLRGPVQDLHRAEGVHVDPGNPGLHRIEEIQIEGTGQVRVDPALHAHLARPLRPTRPRARSATSPRVSVYASGSTSRCANAQKRHPT